MQEDRQNCIDCGAVLGESLSKAEAERIDAERESQIEEMSERCAEFYVSPRRRVCGICGLVLAGVCAVILWLASSYAKQADGAVVCALIGLVCGISAALALLAPKFTWKFVTLRFRMMLDGEFSPSDSYMIWSTVAAYAVWGIGALMAAFALIQFFIGT